MSPSAKCKSPTIQAVSKAKTRPKSAAKKAKPRLETTLGHSFSQKPPEFERDVAQVQETSVAAEVKSVSSTSSDLESDSLISKGSMDEFDRPFYSKNDVPTRRKATKYYRPNARRCSSLGFVVEEKLASPTERLPANSIIVPNAFHNQTPTAALAEASAQHVVARLVSYAPEEYPRFIALTPRTLENEADSFVGIPVGYLTVQHQTQSEDNPKHFPVYVLQQRLGLMATTAQLTPLGLMPSPPMTSILDTVRRGQSSSVQLSLTLFQEHLLTDEEKKSLPMEVTFTGR